MDETKGCQRRNSSIQPCSSAQAPSKIDVWDIT
jgi:hypothetical protein